MGSFLKSAAFYPKRDRLLGIILFTRQGDKRDWRLGLFDKTTYRKGYIWPLSLSDDTMSQWKRLECSVLSFWSFYLQYSRLRWCRNFHTNGLTFLAWRHQHSMYVYVGLSSIPSQKLISVAVVNTGRYGCSFAIHIFTLGYYLLFHLFIVLLNWLGLLQPCQGLVVLWYICQWGLCIEHRPKRELRGRVTLRQVAVERMWRLFLIICVKN